MKHQMHEITEGGLQHASEHLAAVGGMTDSVWNIHAPLKNWDQDGWNSSSHRANIANLFESGEQDAGAGADEKSASWPLCDLSDTTFKQIALMTRAHHRACCLL